jgi:hypothetical protein
MNMFADWAVASELRALLKFIEDLERNRIGEDIILTLVRKQIMEIIKSCDSGWR